MLELGVANEMGFEGVEITFRSLQMGSTDAVEKIAGGVCFHGGLCPDKRSLGDDESMSSKLIVSVEAGPRGEVEDTAFSYLGNNVFMNYT